MVPDGCYVPHMEIVPKLDMRGADFTRMSRDNLARLLRIWPMIDDYLAAHKFDFTFPENGPIARHLYPKHMAFFELGRGYRERCFMAANRVGKTLAGSYEMVCHLTGLYPHWWAGRRFDTPVVAWAAGVTNEQTRDVIQSELLGEVCSGEGSTRKRLSGTGMMPRHLIEQHSIRWKRGVDDLVDKVRIRHVSGGTSYLGFKSFAQGRKSFQGVARHVIWLDEECPEDVYEECLIRTATTAGIVMVTFTPLMGLTEVVRGFLPPNYYQAV